MPRDPRHHLEELLTDSSLLQLSEDDVAAEGAAVCLYCGCTEDDACELNASTMELAPSGMTFPESAPDGVTSCSWYVKDPDYPQGVCTAAPCVRAYIADTGAR